MLLCVVVVVCVLFVLALCAFRVFLCVVFCVVFCACCLFFVCVLVVLFVCYHNIRRTTWDPPGCKKWRKTMF